MLAYKPKEEPLLLKIIKSGMFQFLMVVFLGIGVTYFVVRTDQPQQWIQKINRFASVSPNLARQAKTAPGVSEDQAEFETPPPAPVNTWAARSASPTEVAAMTTAEGTAATATSAGSGDMGRAQIASAPVKVRLQMVEIDHNYINNLVNEGKGSANTLGGDVVVFRSNPNFFIDRTALKDLKTEILDFTNAKNKSMTAGNNARWIRFTASVLNLQGSTKFFEAFFIKNHPNDTQQIPIDLTLAPGEMYIISGTGLLSYFDIERELANIPPFTVFKSADYRNQKTTFALIIQLQ